MIEYPEALVLSRQIEKHLKGKRILKVQVNQTVHKLLWFNANPEKYVQMLNRHIIDRADAYAGFVEIKLGETSLVCSDGINIRYLLKGEALPKKHQLCLTFDDDSNLVFYAQMYGGILCFENAQINNVYYSMAKEKPQMLSEDFNLEYFMMLMKNENKNISLKGFLATEQRIPGLGNGVLQDILYNAGLHPKRKIDTLSDVELKILFESIKGTIFEMSQQGGRNMEKDLFGLSGGYRTKMCKFSANELCQKCGSPIVKEAYMGGSIYFCESCQRL